MMRFSAIRGYISSSTLRKLSTTVEPSVVGNGSVTDNLFRTVENNPLNHGLQHEGRFYKIATEVKKQLFHHGGLPKTYDAMSDTMDELCIMVRKPSIEILEYLKKTNFDEAVVRYVLYGKTGTGKSLSLAHVVHYGYSHGFILVHVPWAANWFRRFKEVVPSSVNPNKFDHPIESVEWLRHFSSQNATLLNTLQLKTTETYNWSKREATAVGAPLTELIEMGLNRGKHATGCIVALLEELKKAATSKQCRMLVVIDGFNSFFSPRTRFSREDKSVVLPSEFMLTEAFLSLTKNDWSNGAVVVSVDPLAHPDELRGSHFPRYQLGKEGFEHLDPFVPVEVVNYTEKEMRSQLDYFIERNWLQQPAARTEKGRAELSFTSGNHPYTLMKLVAPY